MWICVYFHCAGKRNIVTRCTPICGRVEPGKTTGVINFDKTRIIKKKKS